MSIKTLILFVMIVTLNKISYIYFFKWTYTSTYKRIALNCKTATALNCIIIYIANFFFFFWWDAGTFNLDENAF